MIKPLLIVQGRMGSARLPGKTLQPLAGKPSLGQLLDSLSQGFAREQICVATSTNAEDEPIARYAEAQGFRFFRGDQENVASRFRDILAKDDADVFVRLNADSPLLDHRTVEQAVKAFEWPGDDIVTTVSEKPFPSGMNVEVLKRTLFLEHYAKFSKPGHFEHVTTYFYENRALFKIRGICCAVPNAREYRFTLDTAEDRDRIEKIFANLDRPHFAYTLAEKCALYDRLFRVK